MGCACDHVYTVLARARGLSLGDFRCRAPAGSCSPEEHSAQDGLAFIRRGVFERRIGSRRALGAANHTLFYPRDIAHRTRHPVGGGDDCTVLSIDRGALDEIALAATGRPASELPMEGRPLPAALHLAQWRALRRCAHPETSAVEMHERMLALALGALRALSDASALPESRARADTRRAHRDMAHDTALRMAAQPAAPWTLDALADAACSSPFHLARVFRREMGAPMHRWLLNLRLREAVSRLAQGADDLTALALDLGFASRGHLSDALRAAFAAPPSALRRELRDDRSDSSN